MPRTRLHARRAALALAILSVLPAAGCATMTATPCADLTASRQALLALVRSAKATTADRLVVHLSHTCNVSMDGKEYPVVDLQEVVPGATTPRGVNSILLFAPSGALVQKIEYTTERPLFCLENRLYVWGDLRIEGVPSEGNEITFSADGTTISLRHLEAKDVPALNVGQAPLQ